MSKFNQVYWTAKITKPNWYMEFLPWFKKMKNSVDENSKEAKDLKEQIRLFFEENLATGKVALGKTGQNFDAEREPINTIVIHHTSAEPGYRLDYMNAVQLINVYAPYYAAPTESEKHLRGQPIWSGHLKNGQQVFYAYHWLMRMDGSFERLLTDNEIGWQAGDWGINKRSVGICLDNDYENQDPTNEILQKLAAHIKLHYPQVEPNGVIGHCEANKGTICPGKNFLSGWKPEIIKLLKSS